MANAAARSVERLHELEDKLFSTRSSNLEVYPERFPFASNEPKLIRKERSMEAKEYIGNLHEWAKESVRKYFEDLEENQKKELIESAEKNKVLIYLFLIMY